MIFPRSLGYNEFLVTLENESLPVSIEKSFVRVDPVLLLRATKNIVETQWHVNYSTFTLSKIKVIIV